MAGKITKMEETEMAGNRGSALLIFLTGLGAGIAVTALLAPRSGAATRRLIGRKVERPHAAADAPKVSAPAAG